MRYTAVVREGVTRNQVAAAVWDMDGYRLLQYMDEAGVAIVDTPDTQQDHVLALINTSVFIAAEEEGEAHTQSD